MSFIEGKQKLKITMVLLLNGSDWKRGGHQELPYIVMEALSQLVVSWKKYSNGTLIMFLNLNRYYHRKLNGLLRVVNNSGL